MKPQRFDLIGGGWTIKDTLAVLAITAWFWAIIWLMGIILGGGTP